MKNNHFCLLTGLLMLMLVMMGCQSRPTTLEEQQMAYETMVETSPRNMNEQPKAVQEFKFTFGGPPKTDCREQELETSDRDILLDN